MDKWTFPEKLTGQFEFIERSSESIQWKLEVFPLRREIQIETVDTACFGRSYSGDSFYITVESGSQGPDVLSVLQSHRESLDSTRAFMRQSDYLSTKRVIQELEKELKEKRNLLDMSTADVKSWWSGASNEPVEVSLANHILNDRTPASFVKILSAQFQHGQKRYSFPFDRFAHPKQLFEDFLEGDVSGSHRETVRSAMKKISDNNSS